MRFSAPLAVLSIAIAPAADATEFLRCGHKLVGQGDTRDKVLALCGEPADIAYSSILRRPSYVVDGRTYFLGDEMVEVRVEKWLYNFGPNKLMRRIKFVDGVVEDIESLGYGHHPAN